MNPTREPQNLHRTGETDSWRAQTNAAVHQDPEERSSDPTRNRPKHSPECPGGSTRGISQGWHAAGLRALSAAVCAWDLWKEVAIISISSSVVWPWSKKREGISTTHQQKIGLKIY